MFMLRLCHFFPKGNLLLPPSLSNWFNSVKYEWFHVFGRRGYYFMDFLPGKDLLISIDFFVMTWNKWSKVVKQSNGVQLLKRCCEYIKLQFELHANHSG
jgi:hypothetical protein